MRAWIISHRYAFRAAVQGLVQEPWSWLSSALVIATAVLLPWLLFTLVNLVSPNLRQLATEPEISVFMKIEANSEDLAQARSVIEQQLKSLGGAGTSATVTWVSKAQALEQLKAQMTRAGGNSNAMAALQENPLPEAFVIQLPHLTPTTADTLAESLRHSIPKVDLVQADTAWMQTLSRFIRVLNLVLWLTAGIFCVVVMAVTFNATRSQALQLRDEIEVARLVGATDAFIRRPFFYRGALLGCLGGACALLLGLALLVGGAYALQPVSSALSSLLRDYAVAGTRWAESSIVISIVAFLGALGGGWAAQRQLGVFKKIE